MKPYTLITGASSGIGRELAVCADADGQPLVLVARDKQALETFAKTLTVPTLVIAIDLTSDHSVQTIVDRCKKSNIKINRLINNAGIGDYGDFQKSDSATQSKMITLNITVLTELTHAFLPDLIAHKGHLMNIGSVAGFLPGPKMSVYFATKHYVIAFSEALSEELRPYGVHVTCLCPGPVASKFGKTAHVSSTNSIATTKTTPREVALYAWTAMKKRKIIAIYGIRSKLLVFVTNRLLPRSLVRRFVMNNQ